jgi:hypothetical protein
LPVPSFETFVTRCPVCGSDASLRLEFSDDHTTVGVVGFECPHLAAGEHEQPTRESLAQLADIEGVAPKLPRQNQQPD